MRLGRGNLPFRNLHRFRLSLTVIPEPPFHVQKYCGFLVLNTNLHTLDFFFRVWNLIDIAWFLDTATWPNLTKLYLRGCRCTTIGVASSFLTRHGSIEDISFDGSDIRLDLQLAENTLPNLRVFKGSARELRHICAARPPLEELGFISPRYDNPMANALSLVRGTLHSVWINVEPRVPSDLNWIREAAPSAHVYQSG